MINLNLPKINQNRNKNRNQLITVSPKIMEKKKMYHPLQKKLDFTQKNDKDIVRLSIEKLKKNNLVQYKLLENTHKKRMERFKRKRKRYLTELKKCNSPPITVNNLVLKPTPPVIKNSLRTSPRINKNKPNIFISHNWGVDKQGRENHERVIELNKKLLLTYEVKTWLDDSSLHGDIINSITNGIDNCDIVLVCITRDYINKCKKMNNDNCKMELNYSYERKGTKNIIPLVMEEDCLDTKTWDGPVGAYLNKSLYLKMDDLEYKNLDKLVDEINRIYNLKNKPTKPDCFKTHSYLNIKRKIIPPNN